MGKKIFDMVVNQSDYILTCKEHLGRLWHSETPCLSAQCYSCHRVHPCTGH